MLVGEIWVVAALRVQHVDDPPAELLLTVLQFGEIGLPMMRQKEMASQVAGLVVGRATLLLQISGPPDCRRALGSDEIPVEDVSVAEVPGGLERELRRSYFCSGSSAVRSV